MSSVQLYAHKHWNQLKNHIQFTGKPNKTSIGQEDTIKINRKYAVLSYLLEFFSLQQQYRLCYVAVQRPVFQCTNQHKSNGKPTKYFLLDTNCIYKV